MSHKTNWIEALEKELRLLSEEDRSDIILNYQEQIKAMLNEGKSEDEILQRLGSPKEVAKEVKLALGIEHQENLFEKIEQGANEALNFFADVVSRQDCEGKRMGEKLIYLALWGVFFVVGFGVMGVAFGLTIGGIVLFFVSFLFSQVTWSIFFLLFSLSILIFNSGLALFYGLYRMGRFLIRPF
ncbi:DUF1700 domain-containing protein [Turicibacter sanguinis]|uniref:DUF1700 domain-containing protein n=4 Tax=Turicibacter sanguinis TaxID=154288 RepID=A0A9X4XFB6_9FIRM|nr:DUF1700 domain-containing protein [Turicibacter sanguinis]EFF63197.1 conserved hypothetical protein [Turicibacter sanguinis PC909]MCU7192669.1 DUF1700 domain-containing protein [Turicibacter sanguinis]MCU7212792.1 DUF1700 domain-containing protein [Turicibacter sanguinis]MDB8552940.1 DUF1700 domain-containing protein [Turicibacter sanguinis]MTK22311.1 DUF1700 domain-containing protein [Turicibacter sanguinis]